MAASDLTTLANVKQWMGITSNTEDAALERLITAASNGVVSYLNRDLFSASYDLRLNGKGGVTVVLPQYPVTAVSSVVVNGVSIPVGNDTSDGYFFDEGNVYLRGYTFSRGVQNVRIQYVAGFSTIPYEIEQAVIELVSLRHKERDRIGITSKGLAGETVTFTQKDFTNSIKNVLSQFKKVVPT